MQAYDDIKKLITQNRLFEAIQELYQLPVKGKIRKNLAVYESRLNGVNEKIRLGILSEGEANIELNKIRLGLLDICEQLNRPTEETILKDKRKIVLAAIAGLVLVGLIFIFSRNGKDKNSIAKLNCSDHKVAVLVADFQNNEKDTYTDAFANSLVTSIDNSLNDNTYEVRPIGRQTRQIFRYNDTIRLQYFENSCDTSGLFVNGFLDPNLKVFNMYITLANMEMKAEGFSDGNSIGLDNPEGLEFSVSEDAKFLADFIVAILQSYEGKAYEALKTFFELEKEGSEGILKNDDNFKATLAHYKGNCYALRGDNKRAKEQYTIAKRYGNPEVKQAAENNGAAADEVNEKMKEDPEMRSHLSRNLSEHSQFEEELKKFLKSLGRDLDDVGKDIGRFLRKIK
ncbi:MAG: hypothetical protein AAGG68_26240 [Bacteroidota bacterium]